MHESHQNLVSHATKGRDPERTTRGLLLDTGKPIVIPGQGVDIYDSIRRYDAGTLIERLEGYYFDAIPDEKPMPDLFMLSHIERLELLHEQKAKVKQWHIDNPPVPGPSAVALKNTKDEKSISKADKTESKTVKTETT